jgi:hypothetical protein
MYIINLEKMFLARPQNKSTSPNSMPSNLIYVLAQFFTFGLVPFEGVPETYQVCGKFWCRGVAMLHEKYVAYALKNVSVHLKY